MMGLHEMRCVPCEGIGHAMRPAEARKLLRKVSGWRMKGRTIVREFKFKDFVGSVRFVNKIMRVAEREGHHPDLHIHWNRVLVELWTHAVGGLSRNDFIVAAKINRIK